MKNSKNIGLILVVTVTVCFFIFVLAISTQGYPSDKECNPGKLELELKNEGIPVFGCSNKCAISFKPEATPQQKDLADTIIEAHNKTWNKEEREKILPTNHDMKVAVYSMMKKLNSSGIDISQKGRDFVADVRDAYNQYPIEEGIE